MPRLFFEVQYRGTLFRGFQVQKNAKTIQGDLQEALKIYLKEEIELTGSSRTDAGVHAIQNFFHADVSENIAIEISDNFEKSGYNLNSILSRDIRLINISRVEPLAHCRFDAIFRQYTYTITHVKNPFGQETEYFYPFCLDQSLLEKAATYILSQTNFQAFSKKHTQVNNFRCTILESRWTFDTNGHSFYRVKGTRFLRGMVKALVGTMLLVGRKKMPMADFEKLFESTVPALADFTPPSHGLCLIKVGF